MAGVAKGIMPDDNAAAAGGSGVADDAQCGGSGWPYLKKLDVIRHRLQYRVYNMRVKRE